jgi:hypothetical protein
LAGGALRGGWTSLLKRVAEDRKAEDREEIPPLAISFFDPVALFSVVYEVLAANGGY